MSLFAELDRLKAEIDALRPLAPEQEQRVLQKFRLDWNYNSNAIEGNSLTLGETRSLLLHGLTAEGKPLRDHLDIKGHDEAVRGLEEIVHDDRPLTEQFIREMHQVLLGDEHYKAAYTAAGQPTRQRIVPGQYKTSSNNVRTATGETFYFASPEETPARMNDLIIWYRQEVEMPTLHPVALAAEFHHRFVSIHPFDDGNGRMSRLLMNLILMRHGYPITVIKADETNRNRYLAALSEADAGEPEPFLRFVSENVEASLRLMIRAAKGESIEEPDDLDKKLALLKKRLKTRDEFNKAVWSLTNQKKIHAETLTFWLADLANEASRFDELFAQEKARLAAHDIRDQSFLPKDFSIISNNGKNVLEFADRIFNNNIDRLTKELRLYFEWDNLLDFTYPFSLGAHLEISFNDYSYQVSFAAYERGKNGYGFSSQVVFESSYLDTPSHQQIHEINHRLANKIADVIFSRIEKADTPPA